MYIDVLVEISSIDKTFTYHVPSNKEDLIKVGIRVLVPFAKQKLEGFVINITNNQNYDYEVKDILEVIDNEVILTTDLIDLGNYLSNKTLTTKICAYQTMLPKALKASNKNKININYVKIVKINHLPDKITDKQDKIIHELLKNKEVEYTELKKINSSVDTLIKNGYLEIYNLEKYRLIHKNENNFHKKILNDEQLKAFNEIKSNLNNNKTFLLHGITGSGKTEVYMNVIEEVKKCGKSAILLVPEITLTNQIYIRFKERFDRLAVLHSGLSDGERYDEYRRIRRGEVDIVIGARSAIFAPLTNIGIIIIDECHADCYLQDSKPKYDAIDIANYRSNKFNCPLVLGSATPTLTMYAKASKGLYTLLELKSRANNAKLPKVILADMTKEKLMKKTSISETLYKEMEDKLSRKEQIILLLNRRGYASSYMCRSCGHVIKCPHCDISLTYHKTKNLLRCHYCGYATNFVTKCPVCHEDALKEIGNGTEKIEEELKALFNDAKVIRMDLDTTTKKGSHEKIINAFANHEYDILLGTQMIAKGLDFPNVTLVGVINADTSLYLPSYLSSENTYDLINQVSGRSGRSTLPGKVVIQSYNTDHYAITYASKNDYLGFYLEEMENRKALKYPPYFYICYLEIKSKDYELLSREVNKINSILTSKLNNFLILGPTPSIPFKINDIFRFGIILKYKKEENLYNVLNELIEHYRINNKIVIDINFHPRNI